MPGMRTSVACVIVGTRDRVLLAAVKSPSWAPLAFPMCTATSQPPEFAGRVVGASLSVAGCDAPTRRHQPASTVDQGAIGRELP
jgi:hypothetical protein